MSQLDLAITFSHFFGLIICFYVFLHYLVIVMFKFLYNQKLRSLEDKELNKLNKIDNNILIRKILKL